MSGFGQGEFIAALIPKVRDIRRNGAAAVDLCHVASGAVDGYLKLDLRSGIWLRVD